MPEVTGTVSDKARQVSYIVKIAGSDAAEVFAFNARNTFQANDRLLLSSIPTLLCPTYTGNTDESNRGHYVLSDIILEDIKTSSGSKTCPISGVKFDKQAVMKPYDDMRMIPDQYLVTGELTMTPFHPGARKYTNLTYLISLIEVGNPDHLETPIRLAEMKRRLFNARAGVMTNQPGPSNISFRPIEDDSATEDSSGVSETSSRASDILAGSLNLGRTTAADRIICGQDIERNLTKALASGLNPNFEPWMASTEVSLPSGPVPSDPSPEGSGSSSSGSPKRPGSRSGSKSPSKRGRRRSPRDETYRQPSIRSFCTPTSPQPPNPVRSALPVRQKRRSQRLPEEPPSKKTTLEHDQTAEAEKSDDPSPSKEDKATSPVEEIMLNEEDLMLEPTQSDPDTSNEQAAKGYASLNPNPDLSLPTPPTSVPQSRASSMTTNPGTPQLTPAPSNPSSSQIDGVNVSFHSNLPLTRRPRHLIIKSTGDHLTVKVLTWQAHNLSDIVRCFFEEQHETDNPEAGLNDTLESLLTPENSVNQPNVTSVDASLDRFSSSSIQTFIKTESPQGSTMDHSIPKNSIQDTITIDDSNDDIKIVDSNDNTKIDDSNNDAENDDSNKDAESDDPSDDVKIEDTTRDVVIEDHSDQDIHAPITEEDETHEEEEEYGTTQGEKGEKAKGGHAI